MSRKKAAIFFGAFAVVLLGVMAKARSELIVRGQRTCAEAQLDEDGETAVLKNVYLVLDRYRPLAAPLRVQCYVTSAPELGYYPERPMGSKGHDLRTWPVILRLPLGSRF